MNERAFFVSDTSLIIQSSTGVQDRVMRTDRPDYETFNRLMAVLTEAGFTIGRDPKIERDYKILGKHHREGRRPTPAGDLWLAAEVYPTGIKVEFFQEVVTENRNGGRYDFDRKAKMPYLIRKAFEAVLRRARFHLVDCGFVETVKIDSPVPDPLAYFDAQWDGEWEKRRGTHRFRRGADGWPHENEIGSYGNNLDRDKVKLEHGAVRYFRTYRGHLLRGRVYGGINGRWLVIYGPGLRDHTHVSSYELFLCDPREVPRRLHPQGEKRLQAALSKAVAAEDYERAIVLRDTLKRAA